MYIDEFYSLLCLFNNKYVWLLIVIVINNIKSLL